MLWLFLCYIKKIKSSSQVIVVKVDGAKKSVTNVTRINTTSEHIISMVPQLRAVPTGELDNVQIESEGTPVNPKYSLGADLKLNQSSDSDDELYRDVARHETRTSGADEELNQLEDEVIDDDEDLYRSSELATDTKTPPLTPSMSPALSSSISPGNSPKKFIL